jgi:urease accessory protein
MILVEKKIENPGNLGSLERDMVTLDWEGRRRSRQRVVTGRWLEMALAFPTGTLLNPGDLLYVDAWRYVVVEAALEEVIVISPRDGQENALLAYEIGNRHMPLSIGEDVLLVPYDQLLEALLRKQGVPHRRDLAPFEPARKGHSHG